MLPRLSHSSRREQLAHNYEGEKAKPEPAEENDMKPDVQSTSDDQGLDPVTPADKSFGDECKQDAKPRALLSECVQNISQKLESQQLSDQDAQGLQDDIDKRSEPEATPFVRNVDGDYELEQLVIPGGIYLRLYDYQREGLLWLWNLRKATRKPESGGILGDDMGLGKTVQICAFLHGLYNCQLANTIILVMPLSMINYWVSSLENWAPGVPYRIYHGAASEKKKVLREMSRARRPGILITTYGTVRTAYNDINRKLPHFDYMVLDEGHKIKGHLTGIARAVRYISAQHRIILTGTPLQNNLTELWSLFDFATHGLLLGELEKFKSEYERPILGAHDKEADYRRRNLGAAVAQELREKIKPYMLRRHKGDATGVLGPSVKKKDDAVMNVMTPGKAICNVPLPKKTDLVVWIRPSQTQVTLYRGFLQSKEVQSVLAKKRSALASLVVLKKICDHPWILSKRSLGLCGAEAQNRSLGGHQIVGEPNVTGREMLEMSDLDEDLMQVCVAEEFKKAFEDAAKTHLMLQNSAKLSLTLSLLESHLQDGHRTLVFSASRKMLDLIQEAVSIKFGDPDLMLRLDGTTSRSDRQTIIEEFMAPNSKAMFMMLTTGVGGLGLTLTAASRVIIYDPCWNPTVDAQAVDRAYRIGQTKSVLVYRLITCGTIEEHIYKKQVFKGGLANNATGQQAAPRFFARHELHRVFELHNTERSATQIMFRNMTNSLLDEDVLKKEREPFEPHLTRVKGLSEVHDYTHNNLIFQVAAQMNAADPDSALTAEELEKERERERREERGFDCKMFSPDANVWTPEPSSSNHSIRSLLKPLVSRLSQLWTPSSSQRNQSTITEDLANSSIRDEAESSPHWISSSNLSTPNRSLDTEIPRARRRKLVLPSDSEATPQGLAESSLSNACTPDFGHVDGANCFASLQTPHSVDLTKDSSRIEGLRVDARGPVKRGLPQERSNDLSAVRNRASDGDSSVWMNELDAPIYLDDPPEATEHYSPRRPRGRATRRAEKLQRPQKSVTRGIGQFKDAVVIQNGDNVTIDLTLGPQEQPNLSDYSNDVVVLNSESDSLESADDDCVIVGDDARALNVGQMMRSIRSVCPQKNLTQAQRLAYDRLLETARRNEAAGREQELLGNLFDMLDICDEDRAVQLRCIQLCRKLNVLSDYDFQSESNTAAQSTPTAGELLIID